MAFEQMNNNITKRSAHWTRWRSCLSERSPFPTLFFVIVVSSPFFIPVVPSSPHPPFPFQTACPYFLCLLSDSCSWALCLKGERSRREIVSPTVKKVHLLLFLLLFFLFLLLFFLSHSLSNLPALDYFACFPLAETYNKKNYYQSTLYDPLSRSTKKSSPILLTVLDTFSLQTSTFPFSTSLH